MPHELGSSSRAKLGSIHLTTSNLVRNELEKTATASRELLGMFEMITDETIEEKPQNCQIKSRDF